MAMEHPHSRHSPADARPAPLVPVDPAQESLVRALRASFNILRVVMIVLVVLYALSGIFRVEPGQQGLVARLGELRMVGGAGGESPVFDEGWYWALPDPFDRKFTITGKMQELPVVTFLFSHKDAATTKDLAKIIYPSAELTPGTDGAMLTGDKNLSHGRWDVQYQIENAADFLRTVGETPTDLARLLQRLTESAVVREVSGRTIEEVTRTQLDSVREGVRRRLQAALDGLDTGVRIVQIIPYTIEPGAVRPAFLDVIRATNEKERLTEEAREAATEILSRAAGDQYAKLQEVIEAYGDAQLRGADEQELRQLLQAVYAKLDEAKLAGAGELAVLLSQAEAQADELNQSVQREFEEFQKYREQLRVQPAITVLGLWVQMRQEILSNKLNEITFIPKNANEVEIHIKSDVQRSLDLEEEAARKRQMGG